MNSSGLIIILIILFIFFRQYKKNISDRGRKITVTSQLIIPILYIFIFKNTFEYIFSASGLLNIIFIAIAVILGCVVGFARSKLNKLTVEKKTHTIYCKASKIDLIILIALICLKFGAEIFLSRLIHGNTLLMITNYLLLFSISAIISKRIIILFKYLKIVSKINTI